MNQADKRLTGKKRLSLLGPSSAHGVMLEHVAVSRGAMMLKHIDQSLVIDDPEFPFVYTGAENVIGEHSSFYFKADKDYEVYAVVKKYDGFLKGKANMALYFLYSREDDSYVLVERKEVENLTEKFGFRYDNSQLDELQVKDKVSKNTVLNKTTSYDDSMNMRRGINARVLFAIDPRVTEDALVVSESFAKKMVTNKVSVISIPLNENALLLNLYGDDKHYRGIPNIGDYIEGGILAATRQIQGNQLFSDLRDNSISSVNYSSDQVYYAEGEVIDINIYCNNKNLEKNFVNEQILMYLNDEREYYRKVYKVCKSIMNSGSKNIDQEIKRWMRTAMNFVDDDAKWFYNDNMFSNLVIEIMVSKRVDIRMGQKLAGRMGNKSVVSTILPDDEMPYITEETREDQYGVLHPVGEKIPIDIITNGLSIPNRTIAAALYENTVTFITDKVRRELKRLDSIDEQEELVFDVLKTFNSKQAKGIKKEYNKMNPNSKRRFFQSCIKNGLFIQKQPFDEKEENIRDSCLDLYDRYPELLKPYNVFVPKRKTKFFEDRDIYIGQFHVGYNYMLMLKQDSEKGYSARSAGAISDESLPEKSNDNKIHRHHSSSTPIRFGEYELPNFLVVAGPTEFALVTALYRSSIDGRRFMDEAIIDGKDYEIPDTLTSRTAEILQVYLKTLGVRMHVLEDDKIDFVDADDNSEVIGHRYKDRIIFATEKEMYYVKHLIKAYKHKLKGLENYVFADDELWTELIDSPPFKKKHLTEAIVKIAFENRDILTKEERL